MFRLFGSVISLSLASTLSVAAPRAKDGGTVPLYFSTVVGDQLVFEISGSGQVKRDEVTETVSAVERREDVIIVTMEGKAGKKPAFTKYGVTDKGIFWMSKDRDELDPASCVLKLPHKPGVSWEATYPVDPAANALRWKCQSRQIEKIEVPAGTFTALCVEAKADLEGDSLTITTWFAPGKGPIKTLIDYNSKTVTKVLKSYSSGKK